MPTKILPGGVALVKGPRYDLQKVLRASERIINALAVSFCEGGSIMKAEGIGGNQEVAWPRPGQPMFSDFWRDAAQYYEVIDFPVTFLMGKFTLRAFLLGKEWCVYFPERDEVRTPKDLDLSHLNPEPVIVVHGPETRDGGYLFVRQPVLEEVEKTVLVAASDLGIDIEKSRPLSDPKDPSKLFQVAFIRFPFKSFGMGISDLRVRCVTPEGDDAPTNSIPD